MEDAFFINIPEEANLQLPSPTLLNYYKGLKDREYWVEGEINEDTLELVRLIINWNKEDIRLEPSERKPIRIFFNSPGGSLDVAYTLYDTIHMSKTPIIGVNIGCCASAAAYIFIACHQRKMNKHGYFIFHQGSLTNLSGEYKQIVASIEDYQAQVEELSALIKERTLYTDEEIARNIIGEWYVHQEEALEKGIVQNIINSIEEVL